ncbi:MAG: D-amino acid aminotransferase, partial [Nitrospinota bacterium]|nr:D-amino acid aminotransferase [Nitrospinota bacterium]
MAEWMVYLNGKFLPESQAHISLFDLGFRSGYGVYDVARTFGGRPYKVRAHVDRLYRSMRYARLA